MLVNAFVPVPGRVSGLTANNRVQSVVGRYLLPFLWSKAKLVFKDFIQFKIAA
jgi:hypothetical protein